MVCHRNVRKKAPMEIAKLRIPFDLMSIYVPGSALGDDLNAKTPTIYAKPCPIATLCLYSYLSAI